MEFLKEGERERERGRGRGREGERGRGYRFPMPNALFGRCPIPFAILIFSMTFSETFHCVSTGKFQVFHRFDRVFHRN